jgi:hypothetical protein
VGRNSEDVALGVGDDGQKLDAHLLGLHIEGEGIRERLLLARLDLQLVRDRGQVPQDALVGRGCLREGLGVHEGTRDKGDLDGAGFLVVDLDEGLGRAAVDEVEAEDVGIGEGGDDVGIEDGRVSGGVGLKRSKKKSSLVIGHCALVNWLQ